MQLLLFALFLLGLGTELSWATFHLLKCRKRKIYTTTKREKHWEISNGSTEAKYRKLDKVRMLSQDFLGVLVRILKSRFCRGFGSQVASFYFSVIYLQFSYRLRVDRCERYVEGSS